MSRGPRHPWRPQALLLALAAAVAAPAAEPPPSDVGPPLVPLGRLRVRERAAPIYPEAALGPDARRVTCEAVVTVSRQGLPVAVDVDACGVRRHKTRSRM